MTDIEIDNILKKRSIQQVAKRMNIEALEFYDTNKAKLSLSVFIGFGEGRFLYSEGKRKRFCRLV